VRNGVTAYVDADWISGSSSSAAALVVPANGDEADRIAGRALIAVALRVVEALAAVAPERIDVTGSGFVAGAVRRLLGAAMPAPGPDERPAGLVETSGDPERVLAATGRLEDMGVLVLAGEPGDRVVRLDLYRDVHLRGLQVVGVPPARPDVLPSDLGAAAADYLDAERPVTVRAGEPLPRASWYRLG
jgi:hypothetical protein